LLPKSQQRKRRKLQVTAYNMNAQLFTYPLPAVINVGHP
jgi:hypothetical protein